MEARYLVETGLQLGEDVGHGCCGVRQDPSQGQCGCECCISKVKLVLEIRKNAENCHGSPPSLHALI